MRRLREAVGEVIFAAQPGKRPDLAPFKVLFIRQSDSRYFQVARQTVCVWRVDHGWDAF